MGGGRRERAGRWLVGRLDNRCALSQSTTVVRDHEDEILDSFVCRIQKLNGLWNRDCYRGCLLLAFPLDSTGVGVRG